jgi:hypothetical protein
VEDAGKGNFTVSAAVFAALNILGSVKMIIKKIYAEKVANSSVKTS